MQCNGVRLESVQLDVTLLSNMHQNLHYNDVIYFVTELNCAQRYQILYTCVEVSVAMLCPKTICSSTSTVRNIC